MALSDSTRRKHVAAAQKHLPAGAQVWGYARGHGGGYPPLALGTLVGGLLAASAAISIALHTVFFPGFLVIVALRNAVSPGRGLVVAPQGLALFNNSFWTDKPTGAPVLLPFGSFVALEERGRYVRLQVGPEQVWVPRSEMPHIQSVVARPTPAPTMPAVGGYVAPFPYPSQEQVPPTLPSFQQASQASPPLPQASQGPPPGPPSGMA